LCELYIGRKFDENDLASLKDFLRDLQVQKPKRQAPQESKPHVEAKFIPVAERKAGYASPAIIAAGERPVPVNLTDLGAKGGAKERVAAYAQTVNSASSQVTSLSAVRVEEELGGGANVSERKARYKGITETSPERGASTQPVVLVDEHGNPVAPKTKEKKSAYESVASAGTKVDEGLVKERLAEVSGPGVKDRLGNYTNVAAASSTESKIGERLADVKGAPGVKDRLGNWTQVATNTQADKKETVQERLADVSGTPGLKARLGNWNQVASSSGGPDPALSASRVADVQGAAGVKDRLGNWSQIAEKDSVIVSSQDPALAKSRTAEISGSKSSIKDRLGAYSQATETKPIVKAAIVIPQDASELPTKDSQGQ